ncbi:nSTAND1 domain-containing NTPase [Streptomyces sp. NPDC002817]|uniref:nSTAND1 domain-containing NTPase n=1 Tax=Streptomyces sp. NPDC088357 TaxID=3154655 RepID=UPI00343DFA74
MGRREKPLDPGLGAVQRFAYALRKLRDEAGTPTYRSMARQVGYSGPTLSAAAAGERLPTLPVVRAYVVACGGDPEEWAGRWREAVAEEGDARVADGSDDDPGPYPGLARFGTGDEEHFHGRGELIDGLVRLTGRARITAVVGASGSGKSSLLRAGLIPALRGSADSAGAVGAWGGAAPAGPAEAAGARVRDAADTGTGTGTGTGTAGRAWWRPAVIRLLTPGPHPARTHGVLFTPHSGPGDTLLVVDQFEEVFTLCADPAERARFLRQLLTAADPAARLRVVIAVRADFYGRCAEHGPLAEALRDSTLLVGPMTPAQLREAVVRPAAARRIVAERALTARIVADVAGEPGGLPLMAHALREVWRRRTGKTLTLAAYEAVGGVQGAVAHTAESVYTACTPAEALVVRALLLRLVNPGDGTEDTRRPLDRTELDADATTTRVLERLVGARLLTVDGDTVELAHEALITAWPRLHAWVDEDRDRLRLHRGLTEAARTWAELGRDAGALYRGVRLTEAREVFGDGGDGAVRPVPPDRGVPTDGERGPRQRELSRLERDFLAVSVAAHEQSRRAGTRAARRLRALTGGLAVLLCLTVVAGATAWRQSDVSARQRDEAEARRAAALSDTLRSAEPRTAMRLALAAWRTADLPETREALRTAAAQSEQDVFTQPEEGGRALNAPAWLDGNGRILTTVVHDKVVQWDVRTHRRIRSVERPGLSENVRQVSADGRFVAYQGPGREDVLIGGLVDGSTRRLAVGERPDMEVAFGGSGRTVLVRWRVPGADDGRATLELWDLRRQRVVMRYERGSDDGAMPVLSRDDRHLAWCDQDGARLRVLDVTAERLVTARAPAATQRAVCQGELTFTADQRAVAAGTPDGVVTWDFRAGRERPLLPLDGGALIVEFAGDYALTWGVGTVAVWRTDLPAPAGDLPREPLLTYPVQSSALGDFRLDPAEGVLRYREGGRTSVVRTLSLHGLTGRGWRAAAAPDETGRVTVAGEETVAVDPAGRTALTYEGTLVDVSTGERRKGVKGVQGEDVLTRAAFSADGRYLAAADAQGRLTLWDARSWRRLAVLRGSGSTVSPAALAFSADGSLLAGSAPDGVVQVWETRTPTVPAARLRAGDSPVRGLRFTADGGRLHITTSHLADRVAASAPRRAADQVCARAEGGLTATEWRRYFPSADYRATCGT